MTRITLSELKNAARDPARRRDPSGSGPAYPTPMPTAASAVRRFHREGAVAAKAALNRTFDRSSHWGPTGPASAVGWANSIRSCFDTYVRLASRDPRPVLSAPVTADVLVGSNSVGVSIDVVLLDATGYVGRHVLWDSPPLTLGNAEMIAGPIVRALQQELGDDRAAGAEVWHLRSGAQLIVDRDTAIRRLGEAAAIVAVYLS